MILFLNKTDLFLEKIKKKKSIKTCFDEYDGKQLSFLFPINNFITLGANTYDAQIFYIEKKFITLNANPQKEVYTHHTCATDTNQVNLIMDNVVDNLVKKNLMRMGY